MKEPHQVEIRWRLMETMACACIHRDHEALKPESYTAGGRLKRWHDGGMAVTTRARGMHRGLGRGMH
jgi:hypothetical protein